MNTVAEQPISSLMEPLAEPCPVPLAEPFLLAPSYPQAKIADRLAQFIALAILLAGPAFFCLHAACVVDPDVWWHLRTGELILQQHAIPRVDTFSSTTIGQPYATYSWLFEILIFKLFAKLGLPGIVAYSTAMILAVADAIHHLIKRCQRDFSLGMLLTAVACFSLSHLYTPRSWLFTILFFVLELDIVLHARRTGRRSELLWLPVIFVLWSNLHIQFIDGLIVLALAAGESLVGRWLPEHKTQLRPTTIVAALLASVAATLANPFGIHIYKVAYELATQPGVMDKIDELKAIPFRSPQDLCVLLLTLAAAGALARARSLPLLETALLIVAACLSFHSQRDVWFVVVVAAGILAQTIPGSVKARNLLPAFATPLAVGGVCIALIFALRPMHIDNPGLEEQLATSMPVHAVEFIRQHGYTGNVYNTFNWGGYLIWSLRQPVSIDGRAALHGDEQIDRSLKTVTGQPGWASDPQLAAASIVILPPTTALTQLLRKDARFKIAYEDKAAAVFIPTTRR